MVDRSRIGGVELLIVKRLPALVDGIDDRRIGAPVPAFDDVLQASASLLIETHGHRMITHIDMIPDSATEMWCRPTGRRSPVPFPEVCGLRADQPKKATPQADWRRPTPYRFGRMIGLPEVFGISGAKGCSEVVMASANSRRPH